MTEPQHERWHEKPYVLNSQEFTGADKESLIETSSESTHARIFSL